MDPWFKWANATIAANDSCNSATLVEVDCALQDFFVCEHSPWANECLDGWCITGQCFFSSLTVSLTVLEWSYKEAFPG